MKLRYRTVAYKAEEKKCDIVYHATYEEAMETVNQLPIGSEYEVDREYFHDNGEYIKTVCVTLRLKN